VILFMQRPANAGPARRDDPNVALRIALRDILRDSGKFRALAFDPTDPTIDRALKERRIAAADAVEPISQEAMERSARALGASYILTFRVVQARTGMGTDTRLLETVGKEGWRTVFLDEQNIPFHLGKRRLKPAEIITIASDAIGVRMGLSSQLPDDLRFRTPTGFTLPRPAERAANPPRAPQNTRTAEKTPPEKVENNPEPEVKPEVAPKSDDPNKTRANRPQTKPEKTRPEKRPEQTKPMVTQKPEEKPTPRIENTEPLVKPLTPEVVIRQDDAPRNTEPDTNSAGTKLDNEALAARYRQAGDLANVITSLRRAINERARDMGLRRQLILAYQERKMLEAALAEAERALQLTPSDPAILRLLGDTMLAKGDIPGAEKAYREAMRLDPGNVASQVALGDALLADGKTEEAFKIYDAAAKADPKSPLPYRRLARAMVSRAAGDIKYYEVSLTHIQQMRALLLPSDTETYREDYGAILRLMESRLRDMLDELQGLGRAYKMGKNVNELRRSLTDLKERAVAATDYLEKMPAAVGHNVTHAHYQQAASLVLQALSLFRENLDKPDTSTEEACLGAQVDARRELTAANKRLNAPK
jgi:tetratricopeptide (TPR) repeat protein